MNVHKRIVLEWKKTHLKNNKIINSNPIILSKGTKHFLQSLFQTLSSDIIFIPKHYQYMSDFVSGPIKPNPDFYQNIAYRSAVLSFMYPISTILQPTCDPKDISFTQFIDPLKRIPDYIQYGELAYMQNWYSEYAIIVDPINITELEVIMILNWLTELECSKSRYIIIDSLSRPVFNYKLLPSFKSNRVIYMNTFKSLFLPFNIGLNIIPNELNTNLLSSKLLKDKS